MSSIHACLLEKKHIQGTLSDMLLASSYWKPDTQTQWSDERQSVGLAKARLYNTKRSKQDNVHYEAALGCVITANARIDNRKAIAKKLGYSADDKPIDTDAKLILYAYAKWGSDCVKYFRGDFTFIIWDINNKKYFCARDHFGVKVLFYSINENGVMLTNEHNAFFTSGWCDKKEIDERWLVDAMWGLVPQPFDSPNPDIRVLPPAHTLEIDSRGMRLNRYWVLKPKTTWQNLSDEQHIDELKRRFEKAVIDRLDTEFPIGTELSEGLDSNGIAGFAAKHLQNKTLHTFSYDCVDLNEKNKEIWSATYAEIEEMLNMHRNIKPVWQNKKESDCQLDSLSDKREWVNRYLSEFYQAFGGVIPFYAKGGVRSRLAQKKNIRVLLSGFGGDHCVSSYGDCYVDELLRQGKLHTLYQILNIQHKRRRGSRPIKALLALLLKNLSPGLMLQIKKQRKGLDGVLNNRAKHHLLEDTWKRKYRLNPRLHTFMLRSIGRSVREKEAFDLLDKNMSKNLTEAELTGRMSRLEYRFPMLDVDLVEFTHSLPSHLKIKNGIERYAFRQILKSVTTERIRLRTKADVNTPKWNRIEDLRQQRKILSEKLRNREIIKRFSSERKLNDCLNPIDLGIVRRLEFLIHVEDFYSEWTQEESASSNIVDVGSALTENIV